MADLAFMMINGQMRQCCVDCGQKLLAAGMFRVAHQCAIPDGQPGNTVSVVVYDYAPGHTLESCKAFIGEHPRH